MTSPSTGAGSAEVWGSTWIPGASPVEGCGDDAGYSIAWVRVQDGPMMQVVVDAAVAPDPGERGEVRAAAVGDESIDVFTPTSGASA